MFMCNQFPTCIFDLGVRRYCERSTCTPVVVIKVHCDSKCNKTTGKHFYSKIVSKGCDGKIRMSHWFVFVFFYSAP